MTLTTTAAIVATGLLFVAIVRRLLPEPNRPGESAFGADDSEP